MCTRFWWGNLRERDHWRDQDVDGRIILRWILRKWEGVKAARIWHVLCIKCMKLMPKYFFLNVLFLKGHLNLDKYTFPWQTSFIWVVVSDYSNLALVNTVFTNARHPNHTN